MREDEIAELRRDAARTYRRPPAPPLEEMWSVVAASLDERAAGTASPGDEAAGIGPGQRRFVWHGSPWLRAAAVLLVGVAIGRGSAPRVAPSPQAGAVAYAINDDGTTEGYLGRAAALLTALPAELREGEVDTAFTTRAGDLLLQTRRLLDAPELGDPALHALLEDLELVLVQVVRLQADRDPMKVDLLEQSLEQRDVLPRLRSAVAFHSTD